jgi:hypothetical protein
MELVLQLYGRRYRCTRAPISTIKFQVIQDNCRCRRSAPLHFDKLGLSLLSCTENASHKAREMVILALIKQCVVDYCGLYRSYALSLLRYFDDSSA